MDENLVENGVSCKCLKDCLTPLAQHTKELHDEALGLCVIEDRGIIIGVEDELEIRIIDDFFDLANVEVVVDVFQLEAELEVLIIEDADLSLRVILENFDDSCRVDEVSLEEGGQDMCVPENLLMACELAQRFHVLSLV